MKPDRSERVACRGAMAVVLVCLVSSVATKSAVAAISTQAALNAIEQHICFAVFWWGRDSYRLGKTVAITLRKDGDVAYAWSTDLAVIPHTSGWANFFTVFSKNDRAVVGDSYGFNLDMQGEAAFEEKKALAFADGAETVQLHVPANCTPRFTPTRR